MVVQLPVEGWELWIMFLDAMKFLLALGVWMGFGLVLGLGVVLAVRGHPWLLVTGLAVFILLAATRGYLGHD